MADPLPPGFDGPTVLWDGERIAAPAAALPGPLAAPAPPSRLAPLAFLGRFSDAEKGAMTAAAMGSPTILLWLLQAMGAQFIDLLDPLTAQGLHYLAANVPAAGLNAARIAAILTP